MRRTKNPWSYRDMVVAGLLVIGTVWFGYLTWGIFAKEERARRDVDDTKAELASLDARQQTLQADLTELNTPRGQEAALRDTMGVAKPGEGVIIVVPEAPATSTPIDLPWWRRMFDWLY
jgi:cell division protein FtsB